MFYVSMSQLFDWKCLVVYYLAFWWWQPVSFLWSNLLVIPVSVTTLGAAAIQAPLWWNPTGSNSDKSRQQLHSALLPAPASSSRTHTHLTHLHARETLYLGQISLYSLLQVISPLIALLPFASHTGWLGNGCNSSSMDGKNNSEILLSSSPQVTKNVKKFQFSYLCGFCTGS